MNLIKNNINAISVVKKAVKVHGPGKKAIVEAGKEILKLKIIDLLTM